ncbi:MAG: UDP-N-acetylglucosamine--LPS N-acetylglucosamine transferase [Planctomycetes bacterium]|nr:UDP-N-acetylglucosamine--LPS N-acetylglucosamine transferase [Planctomycetota bacterium]
MTEHKKRILAISSGGGHWIELLRVRPAFEGHDVTWVTVRESYRQDVLGDAFVVVPDATRWDKMRLARCAMKILWTILRTRPHVVVSTGAAPGFFGIRIGKLLGAKTVWLDSIANVDELSMSGQRVAKHADLWLTQWEHLASPQGPTFRGAVL